MTDQKVITIIKAKGQPDEVVVQKQNEITMSKPEPLPVQEQPEAIEKPIELSKSKRKTTVNKRKQRKTKPVSTAK